MKNLNTNLFWGTITFAWLGLGIITLEKLYYLVVFLGRLGAYGVGVGQGALSMAGSRAAAPGFRIEVDSFTENNGHLFWWLIVDGPRLFIPLWIVLPLLITCWIWALIRNRRIISSRNSG